MSARGFAVAAVLGLCLALAPDNAEAAKRHGAKVTGVVNLNQATAAQLDMLPGVGAKAAQAIIAWREQHKFTRVEELVKVKGFGRKRFAKLKAHLAVTGETTLQQEAKSKEDGLKTEEHASAESH